MVMVLMHFGIAHNGGIGFHINPVENATTGSSHRRFNSFGIGMAMSLTPFLLIGSICH